MKKNIELRIYELLGVKRFRKIVFFIRNILTIPMTMKMTKEERKKMFYSCASNYNLGGYKLENLIKYKKELLVNTLIHLVGILVCLPSLIKIITKTASLSTTIIISTLIILNSYCIMLQRYNNIRINKVIEKKQPYNEIKKAKIKEDLIRKNQENRSYYENIVSYGKEKNVSFDEFLNNSSLDQLMKYRKDLQDYNNYRNSIISNLNYENKPIERIKKLELEINDNEKKDTV